MARRSTGCYHGCRDSCFFICHVVHRRRDERWRTDGLVTALALLDVFADSLLSLGRRDDRSTEEAVRAASVAHENAFGYSLVYLVVRAYYMRSGSISIMEASGLSAVVVLWYRLVEGQEKEEANQALEPTPEAGRGPS